MAVLMPDGDYQLFRPVKQLDAHLMPVRSTADQQPSWTGPGRSRLLRDRTFSVALDVGSWPVNYRDVLVLPDGNRCTVDVATLNGSLDPDADIAPVSFVQVYATPVNQAQLG